jgi:hypothetical protein
MPLKLKEKDMLIAITGLNKSLTSQITPKIIMGGKKGLNLHSFWPPIIKYLLFLETFHFMTKT